MQLKFIKELQGSYSSKVELMSDQNDKLWVLKTVSDNDVEEIINEKYFLETLRKQELNAIKFQDSPNEDPNQILLEYLENSVTVGSTKNILVYKAFGQQVARMHEIKYNKCYQLKCDVKEPIDWNHFILSELEYGIKRIKDKNIHFSDQELNLIVKIISDLTSKNIGDKFSLLHCDLHTNNALYTTNFKKVYLFDKGSTVLSGHPFYDLALILIEFPHLFGLEKVAENDQLLFESLIEGYGHNFWYENQELCIKYTLLRSIGRVGSPFNPYLVELIRKLIL